MLLVCCFLILACDISLLANRVATFIQLSRTEDDLNWQQKENKENPRKLKRDTKTV